MAKTADSWVFIGPTTLRYFSLVLLSVCLGFVCATSPHGSSFPQELLVDSNRAINFADLNYDIDVNVIEEKNTRNRRDSSTSRNSNLTANHFYLWTRTNAGNTSYNDLDPGKPDTIKNSTFVPRTTYIIVHGFLGWGIEPWILFMKDSDLNLENVALTFGHSLGLHACSALYATSRHTAWGDFPVFT
nr:uncharacterized protein LOC113825067 [Penaeus vannamei]